MVVEGLDRLDPGAVVMRPREIESEAVFGIGPGRALIIPSEGYQSPCWEIASWRRWNAAVTLGTASVDGENRPEISIEVLFLELCTL